MDKLKIVWICHFSNPQIREHIKFNKWSLSNIVHKLSNKAHFVDFAQWNTNAIREFEKFDDIELHIIAPFFNISDIQEFIINGVYYHFFHTEDDNIISKLYYRLSKKNKKSYLKNSKKILDIINKINPDIIHLIGAENPYYGKSVLYIPKNKPLIVSLQTLMNDVMFSSNTNTSAEDYKLRAKIEADIIQRANYIGSKVKHFREVIHNNIYPKARFIDMSLAVGEEVTIKEYKKEYDFVYFAANISKAVDYAIEAYAIAKRQYPNITLHIVGGYDESYMENLQKRIKELNIDSGIDFTGKLATHDDVINEIRKARFALLPLKIDIVSGTIRESMANGLPVITTITPGTPILNEKRDSVLLSEKGDFKTMAENMCRLLEDKNFAEQIRTNAATTILEKYSNAAFMNEWRERYYEIMKDFYNK